MERPEVPVYSLAEILNMDSSHVRIFLSTLRIRPSDDSRGQIALKLNQLGKLSYPPPVNSINLTGLIEVTKPSQLTETKNIVTAAGITPSDDRMTLMIQYLSYAQVAESHRFLPLKAEIPVVGGLQFEELPREMRLEILGRVSPTIREAATVSKGMRELADVALLDNIRAGNLVDPTIDIPDRAEYFKLKPDGSGDYFASLPGLWESLKKARQHYGSHRQYLLIYGVINIDTIHRTVPVIGSLSDLSSDINLLKNIKAEYGTDKIKFAGIAEMESYESLMTESSVYFLSSDISIWFIILFRRKLHMYSLKLNTSSRTHLIDLVKQITENTNIEQTYKLNKVPMFIGSIITFSIIEPEISLRIVALNNTDLFNGTLILPSLRDDVYDVN